MPPLPGQLRTQFGFASSSNSGRRALFDLIIIFGVAGLVWLGFYEVDLFERVHEFSRRHEAFEVDELLISIIILSLGFIVFGIRRMLDQRHELALRKAAERHATMLAQQDQLTGLPNRRRFYEVISTARTEETDSYGLLLLDLDGFKQVNDVFGHASGDEALRVVAQRLRALSDDRMVPARLGGDEFAVLVRDIMGADEAARIAENVIAAINTPIMAAGVEHRLSVSIGVTLIGNEAEFPEEYLRRADTALYRAKRTHGSAFAVYEKWMDRDLTEQVKLEHDLRQALAAGEIVPNYQPIVDLKSGDILKFEALARWRHPTRGDVSPSIFISVAEDRGLIADLTDTILSQACRDACAWPASIMLSVNLSPLLMRNRSLGLRLAKILADTGFPPSRLQLEITEQALEMDVEQVRAFLESLKALGVRIALDDFGTGYSSLSRLKRLPFDDLKIDRSFVQSMSENADRTLFVRTIIELGRGLGLTVTAEGIEEAEQRNLLVSEGCTQGQGYLFSKAVPAERVHLLLATQKKLATA